MQGHASFIEATEDDSPANAGPTECQGGGRGGPTLPLHGALADKMAAQCHHTIL
jgi:hypothetical protein